MPAPDVSSRSIAELISLDGRGAIVTGAARGVGAACARRLAEAGAAVAVTDVDEAGADALAKELTGDGYRAIGVGLDVGDSAAVDQAVSQIAAELGTVDVLVNNAGIYPFSGFLDETDDHWHKVLGVNLDGVMRCSRAVARHIVGRGGQGVIVNISSIEAEKPGGPGAGAYVVSKHGVKGLTKAMALELGPVGIRVLAVAPTLVDTPGVQEILPMAEAAGLGNLLEHLRTRVPLGREAYPDDVARVVLFCTSDLAALMTGSTVFVDAGSMVL